MKRRLDVKMLLIGTVASLVLAGCGYLRVANFAKADLSGASGQETGIILTNPSIDWEKEDPILEIVKNDEKIMEAVGAACTLEEKIAPELVPVATAIGKLIFDLYMDEKIKQVEVLEKTAQRTYSGRLTLSREEFYNCSCAILARYSRSTKKLGLIAIVKIKKEGDVFVIQPYYIRAYNSVAVTAAAKKPLINLSIGFSVKAIGKQASGLPGVFSVGEGVVSVPNVEIGPNGKAECRERNCASSDLIPVLPSDPDQEVSVTMSITETGHVKIGFDQSNAELKAIKEALGPALKESLKEYLTEDEE